MKWFKRNREVEAAPPSPGAMMSVRMQPKDLDFLRVLASSRKVSLSQYVREMLLRDNPALVGCMFQIEGSRNTYFSGGINAAAPDWPHLSFEWVAAVVSEEKEQNENT